LKKKHLPVIIFSSAIVIVVFFSTLLGYSAYIQYKKDAITSNYRNSIYELTADIFRNDIVFHDVALKTQSEKSDFPVFEGSIVNRSNKTFASVLIEVSFVDPDGSVLYKSWFHPGGQKYFDGPVFFPTPDKAEVILAPGATVYFVHSMRNCAPEIVERVSMKKGFAKADPSKNVEFLYSIEGLKVL
jgi:hypothetical protein